MFSFISLVGFTLLIVRQQRVHTSICIGLHVVSFTKIKYSSNTVQPSNTYQLKWKLKIKEWKQLIRLFLILSILGNLYNIINYWMISRNGISPLI